MKKSLFVRDNNITSSKYKQINRISRWQDNNLAKL